MNPLDLQKLRVYPLSQRRKPRCIEEILVNPCAVAAVISNEAAAK